MRAQIGSTFPQRRAFAESGAANAGFLYVPFCENGATERPQAFRCSEIKNNPSAEYC